MNLKHSSGKEDLNFFLCISMVQTQDALGRIHFGPCGHLFEQAMLRTTKQCCISIFRQLSLAVLEEPNFKYILLNGHPEIGPLSTNLIKDHQTMLLTKFQLSAETDSEEEDF